VTAIGLEGAEVAAALGIENTKEMFVHFVKTFISRL